MFHLFRSQLHLVGLRVRPAVCRDLNMSSISVKWLSRMAEQQKQSFMWTGTLPLRPKQTLTSLVRRGCIDNAKEESFEDPFAIMRHESGLSCSNSATGI